MLSTDDPLGHSTTYTINPATNDYNVRMPELTGLIMAVAFAAAPPLTDTERRQLATAQDDSALLDEAALYPLLRNAVQWGDDVRPGSMIPDYDAIAAAPGDHRGQLFVIQGKFAGIAPGRSDLKVGRLAQPGPWDDKLSQWGVVVREQPETVAIVWLVDPPDTPRAGVGVEIIARFYKSWLTKDLNNRPTRFLVFVGKSATIVRPPMPNDNRSLIIMLALVALLAAAWWTLRRRHGSAMPAPGPIHRRRDDEQGNQQPLPADPVEALRQLDQHREQ